jgi:glycosyltransferase involved in cell wall biosynthesis
MSNSIMEAMASGLPVVASAAGGTPELVADGVTGMLFPIDDVRAAVDCVTRLLGDADLRHALGRRGRLAIECRHSAETMVARVDTLYRQRVKPRRI